MTRRILVTRRVAVGATLALTAGLGWVGAGPASAATPSVSCPTTNASLKFTPGLTSTATSQQEALAGALAGCTGKSGIKMGSITGTLTSGTPIRCANLLGGAVGSGTEVLHYKGGTSSTVKVNITVPAQSTGSFTINGTVTKGRFKGHKVTGNMTLNSTGATNPGANCSTVPITQINFTGRTIVS